MKNLILASIAVTALACSSKKEEVKTENVTDKVLETTVSDVKEAVNTSESILEDKTVDLEKKAEALDSKIDNLLKDL